jgi:hypothetical protein
MNSNILKIGQALFIWLVGSALFFMGIYISSYISEYVIPVLKIGGDAMGMGGGLLVIPYFIFVLLLYIILSVWGIIRAWAIDNDFNKYTSFVWIFLVSGLTLGVGLTVYTHFVFNAFFAKHT